MILCFHFSRTVLYSLVPQARKEKLDTSLTTEELISLLQKDTSNDDVDTETERETIEDLAQDSNFKIQFQCNA